MCIVKLWWIERANGDLARLGRRYDEDLHTVFENGVPNPQRTRAAADKLCRRGEKPVPVRIVKESEYAKG